MAQSDKHQQLTVTLLMILCMMCYLLSRSSLDTTSSIRNFGKKTAFSVHKYRQLRYTREVVVREEVDDLYPRVDDAVEFSGIKVTDIARPVREKRRSQNRQFKKDNLKPDISVDDSQSIFIEEFLDNIFATENMTNPVIYFSEDISNAKEIQDFNLIEMFLDLILMVKIEESLNQNPLALPLTPNPITVLTTPIPITTVNPPQVSTVTTMLRPYPVSSILNSVSSTNNSHKRLVVDTTSSKRCNVPIITSTRLSSTIYTRTPSTIFTPSVTTLTASPGVNLTPAESNNLSTGNRSSTASAPAFPIYKAIPMIPKSQSKSLSKPESNKSSERVKDELGRRANESGSSNKNIFHSKNVEMLLKQFVASSGRSTSDIFDKIVDLIKELTDDEVSEDLLDFLSSNGKQVIKTRGKARVPNFKHKKFTKYYQNLDVKMKSSNLPETGQDKILSALRQQLTASVLGNKRLRQKANHLPAFQPVDKIDKNTFQSYYKSKILKMMKNANPLPRQVQTKLQQELQESLADQLGDVQAQLQTNKDRKVNAKKRLEEELKQSLKKLLKEFLPRK